MRAGLQLLQAQVPGLSFLLNYLNMPILRGC